MEEDTELARRRLGSVVGGVWELTRFLGAGGVGAVYAARHANGENAAIKILHAELAHKRDVKERFLREGTLANKIAHAGALKILEHGMTPDGSGFLVMELLEGETLSQLIKSDGPLGPREMFGYLDQALDVLAVAHDAGIIHRDLKPDNLFITVTGQLKILDYGLARRLADIKGDFKTKTGLALGTLPYMAPEQARGKRHEVDGRVDLFALGATAFRVLGRRKLHEADSEAEMLMKMASTPAPPLRSCAPKVPLGVQWVVDLALCFAKEARYPDARTMQRDVRDVLEGRAPRYASLQHEQRDHATRVEPVAAAVPSGPPSSRRVARTEPLPEKHHRTEPLSASTPPHAMPPLAPSAELALAVPAMPRPAPLPRFSAAGMPLPPGARSRRRRGLWLGGLAALLAMAALGAFTLLGEGDSQTLPPPESQPALQAPALTAPAPLNTATSDDPASSDQAARVDAASEPVTKRAAQPGLIRNEPRAHPKSPAPAGSEPDNPAPPAAAAPSPGSDAAPDRRTRRLSRPER